MRWVDALKEWNKGSPTWCIARKGTKAYDEVKAIQAGKKIEAAAEPKAEVKPMAQGIDIKAVMRKRKQKAKLAELKQSAEDTVASGLASLPAPAPKKNIMPGMMASIADIAKMAKASRPVAVPPVVAEKQNTSKTELEEELDVGFVYKPAGRRMEQSIFEDIVRMAGEMERAEDKETSNGKIEQAVPRAVKQLKVGDTLCAWNGNIGVRGGMKGPGSASYSGGGLSGGGDVLWNNSIEESRAGTYGILPAFYKIKSIHNNHSTFRVESADGQKKILRLQIYREATPQYIDPYKYSYILAELGSYSEPDRIYVPTKINATPSQASEAFVNWNEQLEKEGWFGPRMAMLYDDMKGRIRIAREEMHRKENEEARVKREKEKQETMQKIKSMIEQGGGLQKMKKEALKEILSTYSFHMMDPPTYMRMWERHIGGGYYSKTLPSKEKLLALIGALNIQ